MPHSIKGVFNVRDVERVTFTVAEAAKMLGINRIKMYEITRRADFPSIRLGRRIVIPRRAFENWLESAALEKKSTGDAGSQ